MEVLLFGFFALFLVLGVPIAISLGASSVVTLFLTSDIPLQIVVQRMYAAVNSFPLMAIPFFVLAGSIMETAGLSKRLVDCGACLVGRFRGGLGQIAVVTSMFFSAISGSGPATTAAVGGIMIPYMTKEGYDKRFAAALQAAAGSMGPIIPPSVLFITYGVVTETPIDDLFLAGILPGILVGLAIMAVVYVEARKHNLKGSTEMQSRERVVSAMKNGIWVLLMPIIVLGGIYGGIFTPTEAAIVAVIYALFLGFFVYRDLKIQDLKKIFVSSAITSAMIMFVISCASIFSWIMANQRIPERIAGIVLAKTENPIILLLFINLILLVAGCLLDGNSATIILAPIMLPIIKRIGMNPVHFGAVLTVNLCLGLITPPVGNNLFVSCGITGLKLEDLIRPILKFVLVIFAVLMLITYIPDISMCIPNLMKAMRAAG